MSRTLLAALLGTVALTALVVGTTTRQAASEAAHVAAIDLPERRGSAPRPPEVPPVPPQASTLTPLQFILTTAWENDRAAGPPAEQRVTRTRDRAHVAVAGGRREWFFQRNPVATDRVTGYLVDHDARRILVHEDSALRSAAGIRGWADVVLMRFDRSWLSALRPTGATRTEAGFTYRQFVADGRGADATGAVEAWWSDEMLMAIEWTARESGGRTVRARVTGLVTSVNEALLDVPAARFPGYRVVDVADTLEDH